MSFASKLDVGGNELVFSSCDFVVVLCFSGQEERSTKSHEPERKYFQLELDVL